MEQAAERRLSKNLEVNEEYFRGRFAGTMDLMVRRVELGGRRAALFAVDGLVNKEAITFSVLGPLLRERAYPKGPQEMLDFVEGRVLSTVDVKRETRLEALLTLLMSGFVLLCLDGCADGLVCGVQGFAYRGPQEPQNEVMQRGAKDGFTESNQLNMAMVRRRMKNPALKFEALQVGAAATPRWRWPIWRGASRPCKQVRQRLQTAPENRAGGGVSHRLFTSGGPGLFSGAGPRASAPTWCAASWKRPGGRFGRGHPQRAAGALSVCGELSNPG